MPIANLDTFLKSNDTTSLIVIKDDTILYEKYFNGYQTRFDLYILLCGQIV